MNDYGLFFKNGNSSLKKHQIFMTENDLLEIKKLGSRFAHNCKCSKPAMYEIMKFNFENYAWEQLGYFCLADAKKIAEGKNDTRG